MAIDFGDTKIDNSKASVSVGGRAVAVVGCPAQNPMDHQVHGGMCTISHGSGLWVKMGDKIRELEGINTFC